MSKDTEALGYLWRRIDADEGPGVWHRSENSDLMRLFSGRDDHEVRDVAAEFRQLAEQRAALLEALTDIRENFRCVLRVNCNCDDEFIDKQTAIADAAIALAQGDAA